MSTNYKGTKFNPNFKYIPNRGSSNTGNSGNNVGVLNVLPSIDPVLKESIFSNIISGNHALLYQLITDDVILSFIDENNNTVNHILIKVDNSLLPEETKIKLLKFFISHGAPINTFNKQYETPLHLAIMGSNFKVVKELLNLGANPNAINFQKKTALQLALNKYYEVCPKRIIPKLKNNLEIKDRSEFRDAIKNKIIEVFNPQNYELFCFLFEDYRDGYQISERKSKLIREISDETNTNRYNAFELKKFVDDKIDQNVTEIVKEMDLIDKYELNPNISKLDKIDIIGEAATTCNANIKRIDKEIVDLYLNQIKNMLTVKTEIDEYENYLINYFKVVLIYISKHVFEVNNEQHIRIFHPFNNRLSIIEAKVIKKNNGYDYEIVSYVKLPDFTPDINAINDPSKIDKCNIEVNPVDQRFGEIFTMDISKYDQLTWKYLIDNYIKTLNLPLEITEDLKTIFKTLEEIYRAKDILNIIELDDFKEHNKSYKFILINYFKLSKIIQIINELIIPGVENKTADFIRYGRNGSYTINEKYNNLIFRKFETTWMRETLINFYNNMKLSDEYNNIILNLQIGSFNLPRNNLDPPLPNALPAGLPVVIPPPIPPGNAAEQQLLQFFTNLSVALLAVQLVVPFQPPNLYNGVSALVVSDTIGSLIVGITSFIDNTINALGLPAAAADLIKRQLQTITMTTFLNQFNLPFRNTTPYLYDMFRVNRVSITDPSTNEDPISYFSENILQNFNIDLRRKALNVIKYDTFSTENQENILVKFNNLNNHKYFLKYLTENDSVDRLCVVGPIVDPDVEVYKYFNINLNTTNTTQFNEILYRPGKEGIHRCPLIPGKISVSDDDYVINTEYNRSSTEGTKRLKLFSNDEYDLLITKLYGPNIVPQETIMSKMNIEKTNAAFDNQRYIRHDQNAILYSIDSQPLNLLRSYIIKELYDNIIIYNDPTGICTIDDTLNDLAKEYNTGGIPMKDLLENIIKQVGNELLTELIRYYKYYYAKVIVERMLESTQIIQNQFSESFKIDIKKIMSNNIRYLEGIDNQSMFINEAATAPVAGGPPINYPNPPKTDNIYYNYNYQATNTDLLCYSNTIEIIRLLISDPKTNYFINDNLDNTLLHQLTNIENNDMFREIYRILGPKLDSMKKMKNKQNKTPKAIINDKIKLNITNFYKKSGNNFDEKQLLFSEIYSDELFTKLKNNNELNSEIPKYIKEIFNNIYYIFNIDEINRDIFQPYYNNKNIGYNDLFDLIYNPGVVPPARAIFTELNNENNIQGAIYDMLIERHDPYNQTISTNRYIQRFTNTLVHVLTLHFSNVYYQIIKKFIMTTNENKFGISDDNMKQFQSDLIIYDPTYKNPNLAQLIILNLYKYNFNEKIISNKSLSSLSEILKIKLANIYRLINENLRDDFNIEIDEIHSWMNKYFETFNTKIDLFLTNYVKFIELQYNLQQIKRSLN